MAETLQDKLARLALQQPASVPGAAMTVINTTAMDGTTVAVDINTISSEYAGYLGKDIGSIKGFDPQKFYLKLEELSLSIKTSAPGIAGYLEEINRQLNQYPELAHKLSPEKIGIIVSGYLNKTGTVMAEVITKRKGKPTTADLEDIGF